MFINLDWDNVNPLNQGYLLWILQALRERTTAALALTDNSKVWDSIANFNWLLYKRAISQEDCITIRNAIDNIQQSFYNPYYDQWENMSFDNNYGYTVSPLSLDHQYIFPYQKRDIDYEDVPYFSAYYPCKYEHIDALIPFYKQCRRRLLKMRYTLFPFPVSSFMDAVWSVIYPAPNSSGVPARRYIRKQGYVYELPTITDEYEYNIYQEYNTLPLQIYTKASRNSNNYYFIQATCFKLKYSGLPRFLIANMNPKVLLQYAAYESQDFTYYTFDSGKLDVLMDQWNTIEFCDFDEEQVFDAFSFAGLPTLTTADDTYVRGCKVIFRAFLDWGNGFIYTETKNTVDTGIVQAGFDYSNSGQDSDSRSDSGSSSGEGDSTSTSDSGSDSASNSGSGSDTGSNSDSGSITPPGPSPDPDDLTYETEVHFYNTGDITGTITDNEQQTFSYSANVGIWAYVRVYYRLNNGTATITGFETLNLNASAQIPNYGNVNITDISVTGISISNYELALWVTWSANGSDYNQIVHVTWQGSSRDKGIADFFYDCNYTWGVVD